MFTSEMGVRSTPVSHLEGSSTESVDVNGSPVQSTPISTRHESKTDEIKDIMAMMQLLLKQQNSFQSDLNVKLEEQKIDSNSNFRNIYSKFEEQNIKNEMNFKNWKEQILESVNYECSEQIRELKDNLEDQIIKVHKQTTDQIDKQIKEQCVEVESKCMNTINKNNDDIQNKIVELDIKCKQDVQSVQENMGVINENYLKYESDNTNKFKIIEQNMLSLIHI